MAQFEYQALDNQGQEVTGTIEAFNLDEAKSKLLEQSLYVFALTTADSAQQKSLGAAGAQVNFMQSQDDVGAFTKQLANLLGAGIQLGAAVEIISQLTTEGPFKELIKEIYNDLKRGQNFAEALEKHPDYFSKAYVGMIKAGEEGGFLDLTCQRLSQDLENSKQLKSFMITSLIYPVVLVVVTILAVLVMITYVLPKFVAIYENYEQGLPYLTKLLLAMSQFVGHYGLWLVLGGSLLVVIIYIYYQQQPILQRKVDQWLLALPIVGGLIQMINVTKIARNLGTMLESGVSLLQALKFSQYVTNNRVLKLALSESAKRVQKGNNLAEAFDQTKVFSPLVIYMVGIGERTGNLPELLLELAANFEENYRTNLKKLMKVFEPLIILIMGIIIALIVVAMLMPILKINTISL